MKVMIGRSAKPVVEEKPSRVDLFYQQLWRTHPVAVLTPDGQITDVNDQMLDLVGGSKDQLVGAPLNTFVEFHSDEADVWAKLKTGVPTTQDVCFPHENRDASWLDATYLPIMSDSGVVEEIILFGPDMTERRQRLRSGERVTTAISRSQAVIEFNVDGTIVEANENFCAALQYDRDEIVGQHHRLFVDEDERNSPEYAAFWASLAAGEFQGGEYRRIAKDGSAIWIQATYNPIIDRRGVATKVIKFATDITEAKTTAADREGKVNAIDRSSAVIEFDLKGNILEANENFLGALKYKREEIVGQHHSMFLTKEDSSAPAYKEMWRDLAAGKYKVGEYRRIDKAGNDVWIQASYNPIFGPDGKPMKVVKFASDITEAKQQSADFAGQINAIGKSQAVIEFNLDGIIQTANENFLGALGYEQSEIAGKHHSMFVDPEESDSDAYMQFWARLRAGEFQAGEFRRIAKSGEDVWIQATYNPILNEQGQPFKVVKYAVDITAQKVAVAALSKCITDLSQGNASTNSCQSSRP